MHLAPTASRRVYQQRVGRVTRRHPGKEAGVIVDFVHPATKHDDPVITLHSLLDRDVYRGGAIVVGPVRRGRGRRVRVERRVIPVTAEEERRHEVFERELWRIAVEHLDYGEQHMWAALAGARVAPSGWRRARAMLHFDRTGELKRRFLLTAVERNRNAQLRVRALQEIAAAKDAEAFDLSIDVIGTWAREERREGAKVMFQALAEKRIGRRDQANAWIWRLAEYTREVHEEYAVQRWPETKRLLGLLVNSSGGAHARNARRLVHAARKQDRRLQAALLAAAVAHTPEAEEVLRGARTRLARKPSALSRELLRNFPKGKGRRSRRRRKKATAGAGPAGRGAAGAARMRGGPDEQVLDEALATATTDGARRWHARDGDGPPPSRPTARRPTATSPPRRSRRPSRAPAASAGARTPIRRARRAGRRPPPSSRHGGRGGADGGRGGRGGRTAPDEQQPAAAKRRSRRSARAAAQAAADEHPAGRRRPAKAAADGSDDEQQPPPRSPSRAARARSRPPRTSGRVRGLAGRSRLDGAGGRGQFRLGGEHCGGQRGGPDQLESPVLSLARPLGLGGVEVDVGELEQLLGTDAVGREAGVAERRGHTAGQRIAQPADEAFGVGRARAGEQHRELVSAEPPDDVQRAQDTAEALDRLAQEGVAGAVSLAIVDRLEVVEVEDREHQRPFAARRVSQLAAQPILEPAPVERVGQRIGRGEIACASSSRWRSSSSCWRSRLRACHRHIPAVHSRTMKKNALKANSRPRTSASAP